MIKKKMNIIKNNIKEIFIINGNNKKMLFGMLCAIAVMLGFLSFQYAVCLKNKLEYNKLFALKEEYLEISDDLNKYENLKNQFEISLTESSDLESNKNNLEKRIGELNNEIEGLEIKIAEINRKIKNLS